MSTRTLTANDHPSVLDATHGRCSLGWVLVAESAVGICALLLGDEPQQLLHELQRRFPLARLESAASRTTLAAVTHQVEHPDKPFALALDLHGSAFRRHVWETLRTVAAGQTISYAELARRCGTPTAVRAVAGACAANPVAVVVPCHRVLRSDGSLGGYRWGLERKRALLAREGILPDHARLNIAATG